MFGRSGSKRITAQGMLAPSDTPIRVYNVQYVSTVSASNIVLVDTSGTLTVTAAGSAVQLVVPATAGVGTWSGGQVGMRFDNGVFVQTSTSFTFAVITYNKEA